LSTGRTIYGVDFSGARDAGKKIWVTEGADKNGVLCIKGCLRGHDLPGSATDRTPCLNALRAYILSRPKSAFGLDFPFGLSRDLMTHQSLITFLVAFPNDYESPDQFRARCLASAGGREKRRETEREAKTPFSPYNLRIYKQTFFGISAVLNPLVRHDLARIVPVQKPSARKPLLLEICPASTLKRLRLYGSPYKGASLNHHRARAQILERIVEAYPVCFEPSEIGTRVAEDTGGDALDSLVAAMAVHQALKNPPELSPEDRQIAGMEGYVYY
jgi:hypothetical protein